MLRFLDSFDHYNAPEQKYDAYQDVVISLSTGRYGTAGCDMSTISTSYLMKTFDEQTGWVAGLDYYRTTTSYNEPLLTLSSGSLVDGYQIRLIVNQNSTLSVTSGSQTLITTTKTISPSSWYYLELSATLGASASVVLHGNGNLWGFWNGSTSGSSADTVFITGAGLPYVDNVYILDTSGSVNNDFWGVTRIEYVYPIADGTYTQWTPSSGSLQYNLVDNNPYDPTQYISSDSPGEKSDFTLSTPYAGTGNIKAIQVSYLLSANDGNAHQSRGFVRSGGVDYPKPDHAIDATLKFQLDEWDAHPSGASWTEVNLASSEFGVESTA